MENNKKLSGLVLFVLLIIPLRTVYAVTTDIDTVFYRKDCASYSAQTCYTDIDALQSWLWGTRKPSAASPVTVKIGPGVYNNETISCVNNGNVSFIGSGVSSTIFRTGGNTVRVTNCENLTFQDMTLDASTGPYSIRWMGGGSSRWINVDVLGLWNAWRDQIGDCNGSRPIHYWFSSRLSSEQAVGGTYLTECGESWFYASEITTTVGAYTRSNNFQGGGRASGVVEIGENAMVQMFGSLIRAVVPDPATVNSSLTHVFGATTSGSATFHMHGGNIGLNMSKANQDISVIGVRNDSSGVIHTPGSAFNLISGGSGSVLRATTGPNFTGKIVSPFLWQASATPPPLSSTLTGTNTANSIIGSDIFIETDCDQSGDCDTALPSEQMPHLMIYTTACDSLADPNDAPWFDVARNSCKGK